MTKKTRIIMKIGAAFLCAVFFFTSGFLLYLQSHAPSVAQSAEDAAAAASSAGISDFGSLSTLAVILVVMGLFIYFIAKS